MSRVRLTPKAYEDLTDIWTYTEDTWGTEQAQHYTTSIHEAFQRLAETPLICAERTEFSPPVRMLHHESHLIVYLQADEVVVRILHERMDIASHLDRQ